MNGLDEDILKTLEGWRNTRDAAVLQLKKNMEVITENAPTSQAYKDARANSNAIHDNIDKIAVLGLKKINGAPGTSALVTKLEAASKKALGEAQAIANATAAINKLSAMVGVLTTLVTDLAAIAL